MKNSTRLKQSLLMGVTLAALACGAAAGAQTAGVETVPVAAPDQPATGSAEIVVTGSRIRGVAPVGSPLIEQSRADLKASGAVNVTQLVQDLPQVINQGVSESSRNSSGGAGNITYSSGFNIHGVGPYATLTLLNGRRIVQSGSSGGLPDPSNIPTIALQRVEVVADGASAIYGSDAVAGVVNLITRRRFDGLEAQSHIGLAKDNDYNEYNLGIIGGHSWSSGNVTVSYEHSGHAALNGRDRSFYAADLTGRGGGDYRGVQCNPANILIGGTSYALPALAAGTVNKCDTLKGQDLIPSQRRDSVMGSITQEIGSRITLTGDILYSKRNFVFHSAPTTATVTIPSSNPYFILPPGVVATSESVETGFGGQAPANDSSGYSKVFQATAGVSWKMFADWVMDGSYTYGRDSSYSISEHGVNNPALFAALASTSPQTALNPFGVNSRSVLDTVFNSVFGAPGINEEHQGELNFSGSLATLPGGRVLMAVGGEIIRDSIYTGLDSGTIGSVNASRSYAARTIKSLYGELNVPIFGADNATAGFRRLDLSLAGRMSDYSDVGTSYNPKVGVNWEPVDGLTLHGSYGTSFRAPVLTQIHGALNALFIQNYRTPTGVVQGATLSGYAGGNPLAPEHARTFLLGADIKLPSVPNLRASVNYFNVRYTGQVNAILQDLSILQSPATAAQYADRIVQGAKAASVIQSFVAAGYPVFGVLPASPTLFVYGQNVNAGKTLAQGIDYQIGYRMGKFDISTSGTYFTKFATAVSPSGALLESVNTIFYPPRFRSRSSVGYNDDANSAIAFWNFTNAYRNNRIDPVQTVSSYSTFDIHLSHSFGGSLSKTNRLTLAVDVQNLFDKDPPFVNIAESPNGGGGFDPTVSNPVGRLISLTATISL